MAFSFRPAKRGSVSLLIGLAGASGSGKTLSAMRLARGLAGPTGKIGFIDTENGRALHYAELEEKGIPKVTFEHALMTAPFSPDKYTEAIVEGCKAGYPVYIIDSASHEHAGDGGILDQHEAELTRMAGTDYKRRDACNMAAWVKPKMAHKRFATKLLQVPAHLILCFRAEAKVEMVKDSKDGWVVKPKQSLVGLDGWIPVCEKTLPYEMTCSFLFTPDKPGFPKPIKLQEQHKPFFPLDKPITEESGRLLAEWAAGGSSVQTVAGSANSAGPHPLKLWNVGSNPTPAATSDQSFAGMIVSVVEKKWPGKSPRSYWTIYADDGGSSFEGSTSNESIRDKARLHCDSATGVLIAYTPGSPNAVTAIEAAP